MKAALQALTIVMVVHVLAAVGLVGWLAGTGRVSGERLAATRQMYAMTVADEKAALERAAAEAEAAAKAAAERAALEGAAPVMSVADHLVAEQERNELLLRQLERTRREIKALIDNLHLSRQRMERQRTEMAAVRAELEKKVADIESRLNTDGFRRAVALYESLPAKQVKQMFIDLMTTGQTDQVVAYMEAMDERKAAGVLKEFKDDSEVSQAVELTERLRARGSDLVKKATDKEPLG